MADEAAKRPARNFAELPGAREALSDTVAKQWPSRCSLLCETAPSITSTHQPQPQLEVVDELTSFRNRHNRAANNDTNSE